MLINLLSVFFCMILYLKGFFPISNKILNQSPKNLTNILHNLNATTFPPKYDKLILIVIDALRLDFINPNYAPFISKKSNTIGCFINLTVEVPTVTLPRIKAMMTGSIPQFTDIILNFASTEILEDSLIHSATKKSKRLVFYGDDTWLRLFPNKFKRSEGTSSFFVNDFHEVDLNVTRNVEKELQMNDWDIMILHYLGLDHIGHVLGPNAIDIKSKMNEMDAIIERIYSSDKGGKFETLVVITGDHGMKNSGGHGGATFSETIVPLIFLGMSHCVNNSFKQIDLPANLAILLGLEIPLTSIGLIQSTLLNHLSQIELLYVLRHNTILLLNKVDGFCGNLFIEATKLHELFLIGNEMRLGVEAARLYEQCSNIISDELVKSMVHQNVYLIIVSIFGLFYQILAIYNKKMNFPSIIIVLFVILLSIVFHFSNTLLIFFSFVICFCFIKNLQTFSINFIFFLSTFNSITFFSSSLIEEEHQFWYYLLSSFTLLFYYSQYFKNRNLLLLLIYFRFVKIVNQTGDKWAALPDVSDWLLKNENYIHLQLFFIFNLVALGYYCYKLNKNHLNKIQLKPLLLNCLTIILIYCFRTIPIKQNIYVGKLIWFLIFLQYFLTNNIVNTWMLICALLLKPHNIVLIPFCIFASNLFCNTFKQSKTYLIVSHLILENCLFFTQGHSNSLASVDVTSGYIGLNSYQPFFVISQVLCHTYCLRILCHILLIKSKYIIGYKLFRALLLHRLIVLETIFVITFIQRHHLFIWTVFAPKLFIEASHCTVLLFETLLYYGYVFFQSKCATFKQLESNNLFRTKN